MSNHDPSDDPAVSPSQLIATDACPFDVHLTDINGLDNTVAKIRDTFVPTIASPAVDVRTPGLLLYGPEGTGIARLARAVVTELSADGFDAAHVTPDILASIYPQSKPHRSDDTLGHLVDELREHTPIALFVEHLEELQVVDDGSFHTAVDHLRDTNERVAVICTLSQKSPRLNPQHAPEYFDFADYRLNIPFPDEDRCAYVLTETLAQLTEKTAITIDVDVQTALEHSTTLEIDDVRALGRRAVVLAQTRASESESPTITTGDVSDALAQLTDERSTERDTDRHTPTTEEFRPTVPEVTFDDIGGLDEAIRRLQELVTYPTEYSDLYESSSFSPARGVLLYGPPGTGKTLLAKALATETDRAFFAVEGAAIKSKWFGQSEDRVRQLFETARAEAPSILFFDEFDALAGPRAGATHSTVQSIVNTLLAELDGVAASDDVLVVAATNRPDAIDPALRRPGRLGDRLEVPPPDSAGQREIFRIHTRNLPIAAEVTPRWFASIVPDGVTGAEIAHIVEDAVHRAIRHTEPKTSTPTIERSHVRAAIETRHESNSEPEIQGYY